MASTIVSLLCPTNFMVLTRVGFREIVFVATASRADGSIKSTLPEIYSRYYSCMPLKCLTSFCFGLLDAPDIFGE